MKQGCPAWVELRSPPNRSHGLVAALGAPLKLPEEYQRAIVALLHLSLYMATLLILFNPAPANAGMLRCASHHLASDERDEVLVRARRSVPANGRSLILKSACWNPDFAIAWLRTPTEVDLDGVRWWWAVRCDRKMRVWSCDEVTRERRIEVSITDTAEPTTIISSFPDAMSSSRARAIITATATLAMKVEMPLPACSQSSDDALRWRRSRFNEKDPDLEYPAVQIEIADAGLMVDYGWSLRIILDSSDRPSCWAEIIIVT